MLPAASPSIRRSGPGHSAAGSDTLWLNIRPGVNSGSALHHVWWGPFFNLNGPHRTVRSGQ